MGRSSNREEPVEWVRRSCLHRYGDFGHIGDECVAYRLGQMGRIGVGDHFEHRCASFVFVQSDNVHLRDVFLLYQLSKSLPSHDYDRSVSLEIVVFKAISGGI